LLWNLRTALVSFVVIVVTPLRNMGNFLLF